MVTIKQKVVEAVLHHLPGESGSNIADLTFFNDLSVFPIGDDLGGDRQHWTFSFAWMDGLETTNEELEVTYFEWVYNSDDFRGTFTFEDKTIQVLGDCEPPRRLSNDELTYVKSFLPTCARLFIVGVYRPAICRKGKNGLPGIGLDALVCYHTTSSGNRKRGLNTLQRLASSKPTPATPATPATPSDEAETQKGSQRGASFIKDLLK